VRAFCFVLRNEKRVVYVVYVVYGVYVVYVVYVVGLDRCRIGLL